MKIAEIKELTTQELEERLAAEAANLERIKINHTVSALDNPAQIKAVRKNITRMKTELSLRKNSK